MWRDLALVRAAVDAIPERAVATTVRPPDPGDVLDLEHRINYTLDAIVAATVDIYSRTADAH